MGQAMDLNAKGKVLTVEELDRICFYKTGIAFEACLVAPAILARANETEIAVLKKYTYHTGMWEHYCLAMEALQELPEPPSFLKHLLHYIMNRKA